MNDKNINKLDEIATNSRINFFEDKVKNMKDIELTASSRIVYIETISNKDLVKLYNEKQTLIQENCKTVRMARSELAKIIDEVDERAEVENISVVEFYEKYEEGRND